MADLSKDLLDEIKWLESIFTVDTAKLKEITAHFKSELERGTSDRALRCRLILTACQV